MVTRSKPTLSELKALFRPGEELAAHKIFDLVGLSHDEFPSASWQRWQKPSPALPIDEAVEGLLKRDRPPKVPLARRALTELCPYLHGRIFVAQAAQNACYEELEWMMTYKLRVEHLSTITKLSTDIQKHYTQLMVALREISFSTSPAPNARLARGSDSERNYVAKDFLQAVHGDLQRALTQVGDVARSTHKALDDQSKHSGHQVWHATFAFWIGRLWYSFFEDVPGNQNDGPFVKLIEEAFKTVCCDEGISWNRAKTAAFERHKNAALGEGFDRYVVLEGSASGAMPKRTVQ